MRLLGLIILGGRLGVKALGSGPWDRMPLLGCSPLDKKHILFKVSCNILGTQ